MTARRFVVLANRSLWDKQESSIVIPAKAAALLAKARHPSGQLLLNVLADAFNSASDAELVEAGFRPSQPAFRAASRYTPGTE